MRKYELRNSTQFANGDDLKKDNRDRDTNSYTDTDRDTNSDRDTDTDTIRDGNRGHIKDSRVSDYAYQLKLIPAFGYWIRQQWNAGWDIYLFTFVFRQLRGPRDAKVDQMFQEVTRVYGRLASRMVRKPRSPRWASILPRGVFVVDRPGLKKRDRKLPRRHVLPNDGLHVHGLVAAKRLGRIRESSLDQHFHHHMDEYLIGTIDEIDVVQITNNPSYATQYGAKGLKRRTSSSDDVLILPRTLDELDKTPQVRDPIKDIQAATNVSDELANEIFRLLQSFVGKRWQGKFAAPLDRFVDDIKPRIVTAHN
jgi:hypothetical protein